MDKRSTMPRILKNASRCTLYHSYTLFTYAQSSKTAELCFRKVIDRSIRVQRLPRLFDKDGEEALARTNSRRWNRSQRNVARIIDTLVRQTRYAKSVNSSRHMGLFKDYEDGEAVGLLEVAVVTHGRMVEQLLDNYNPCSFPNVRISLYELGSSHGSQYLRPLDIAAFGPWRKEALRIFALKRQKTEKEQQMREASKATEGRAATKKKFLETAEQNLKDNGFPEFFGKYTAKRKQTNYEESETELGHATKRRIVGDIEFQPEAHGQNGSNSQNHPQPTPQTFFPATKEKMRIHNDNAALEDLSSRQVPSSAVICATNSSNTKLPKWNPSERKLACPPTQGEKLLVGSSCQPVQATNPIWGVRDAITYPDEKDDPYPFGIPKRVPVDYFVKVWWIEKR